MWRAGNWLLLNLMGNVCKNSFCMKTYSDYYLKCALERSCMSEFPVLMTLTFQLMNNLLKRLVKIDFSVSLKQATLLIVNEELIFLQISNSSLIQVLRWQKHSHPVLVINVFF